ncbi:hypothetical protein HYU17_03105 [Candidatus Woesearchaeota archaeon]|nr:hypothetical protein [Candidatus Woesearchaeota archaeon]
MASSDRLEVIVGEASQQGNAGRVLVSGGRVALHTAHQIGSLYYSLARHPLNSAKAIGGGAIRVVNDTASVPLDVVTYLRNGFASGHDPFADKKKRLSHSLAAGEAVAIFGAFKGAEAAGSVVGNGYAQAIGGGFMGGELTTGAVLFGTYLVLSGINSIRHKGSARLVSVVASTLLETLGVAAKVVPAGLLVFAAIDIPLTAGLVALPPIGLPYLPKLELMPDVAAPLGAAVSAAVYTGTAKAALAGNVP